MSTTNGNNKAVIDCPACNQRFSVEMPKAVTINTPTFSAMIATHEKVIRCLNAKCSQALTWAIMGGQLQWQVAPITYETAEQMSESRIVPAPFLLPN